MNDEEENLRGKVVVETNEVSGDSVISEMK